jgi:hypothetical protein
MSEYLISGNGTDDKSCVLETKAFFTYKKKMPAGFSMNLLSFL